MARMIIEDQTPVLTIGHSTRSSDEFLALLAEHAVELVVDVRKLPGSSRYPQFNADALSASLAEHHIEFTRLEPLTGRRRVNKAVPFEVNGWWANRSFHNYADHALSPEFRLGLEELKRLGASRRAAVMCAEAVWWRCHRRIIADYLFAAGTAVLHVLGPGESAPAELSAGARLEAAGGVTYPG